MPHFENHSYIFSVYFDTPDDTLDIRLDVPFKTIRQEYLIMSPMSFIVNVGGTLGHNSPIYDEYKTK